jgi:hypothetical protein
MRLRKLWHTISATTVIGRTEGWEIHGWKYTPHLLLALCCLLLFYVAMGWELP